MSSIIEPEQRIPGKPIARAAILACALLAIAVSADDEPPGNIVPLQALFAELHGEFPGRILEVELDDEDHGWVYEVKLLTSQGHVLKVEYDAVSLELLEVKGRRDTSSD